MVIVQSLLFLRLALNTNKRNNILSKEELNQAFKSGAVSAIGPAFSTMTVAISLIVMIGSGATFLRCGVIGAPSWELMMASVASQAVGVEFGSAEFTKGIFTLCLFGMTLASAPYFINTVLTLKPLDKAVEKSEKKKGGRSFLPYMSDAAMMGIIGCFIPDYFGTVASTAALITAGIVMLLIMKTKNPTLESFGMAISMICAMFIGQIVTMLG